MPRPIETAPKNGARNTGFWGDRDGQENESVAQYRSAERLQAIGEFDPSDVGWWAYIDSDTQKRIEPHGWTAPGDEEDE